MTVFVVTRQQPDDGLATALDARTIDWRDSSDRKWLMNHLHHCMMNNKSVKLFPESN